VYEHDGTDRDRDHASVRLLDPPSRKRTRSLSHSHSHSHKEQQQLREKKGRDWG
jgi:hypothetical protein